MKAPSLLCGFPSASSVWKCTQVSTLHIPGEYSTREGGEQTAHSCKLQCLHSHWWTMGKHLLSEEHHGLLEKAVPAIGMACGQSVLSGGLWGNTWLAESWKWSKLIFFPMRPPQTTFWRLLDHLWYTDYSMGLKWSSTCKHVRILLPHFPAWVDQVVYGGSRATLETKDRHITD